MSTFLVALVPLLGVVLGNVIFLDYTHTSLYLKSCGISLVVTAILIGLGRSWLLTRHPRVAMICIFTGLVVVMLICAGVTLLLLWLEVGGKQWLTLRVADEDLVKAVIGVLQGAVAAAAGMLGYKALSEGTGNFWPGSWMQRSLARAFYEKDVKALVSQDTAPWWTSLVDSCYECIYLDKARGYVKQSGNTVGQIEGWGLMACWQRATILGEVLRKVPYKNISPMGTKQHLPKRSALAVVLDMLMPLPPLVGVLLGCAAYVLCRGHGLLIAAVFAEVVLVLLLVWRCENHAWGLLTASPGETVILLYPWLAVVVLICAGCTCLVLGLDVWLAEWLTSATGTGPWMQPDDAAGAIVDHLKGAITALAGALGYEQLTKGEGPLWPGGKFKKALLHAYAGKNIRSLHTHKNEPWWEGFILACYGSVFSDSVPGYLDAHGKVVDGAEGWSLPSCHVRARTLKKMLREVPYNQIP